MDSYRTLGQDSISSSRKTKIAVGILAVVAVGGIVMNRQNAPMLSAAIQARSSMPMPRMQSRMAISSMAGCKQSQRAVAMNAFELPSLPWAKEALSPHMSPETIDYHHGKHHAAYVNKLNDLVKGTDKESKSLEDLIKSESGGIFNSAAQAWNHDFFWKCLSPSGGGAPTGAIAAAIERDFGSFDAFKAAYDAAAVGHFGSGWVWLVKDGSGKLSIVDTHDAANPMTDGLTPILTTDVWEHAYYIDYRNARPKYISDGWWSLVNWEFANANLA